MNDDKGLDRIVIGVLLLALLLAAGIIGQLTSIRDELQSELTATRRAYQMCIEDYVFLYNQTNADTLNWVTINNDVERVAWKIDSVTYDDATRRPTIWGRRYEFDKIQRPLDEGSRDE